MPVAKARVVKAKLPRAGRTLNSGAEIAERMIGCSKALTPPEQAKQMREVGVKLIPFGWQGATRDVGAKRGFSGWRRGAPIRFNLGVAPHRQSVGVTIFRERRSAGPWLVAEEGRNQGETGRLLGPGITKTGKNAGQTRKSPKTGMPYKVRSFEKRRWNGVTKGKGTFSHASDLMAAQAPRLVHNAETKAIAKAFLGR